MQLSDIISGIIPVDEDWRSRASERNASLLLPYRALGRLHDYAEQLCAIRRTLTPPLERRAVLVLAADHGVVDEGVSAYPQDVTPLMVGAFLQGWAGINALAGGVGAEVHVADLGVAADLPADESGRLHLRKIRRGTANLAKGPAMEREEAEAAVIAGFELASALFEDGVDVLATGDMGIGNTTASAAVGAVFTGQSEDVMVGRGTGVDEAGLVRKRKAVRAGIDTNRPDPADALDVLAKVGGLEICGIAGAILAGALHQRPVVVDGFISTAGALAANAFNRHALDYCFAGHASAEHGHRVMLNSLRKSPILDLEMRLGEGSGAVLAMAVLDGAVRMFTQMGTFEDAGMGS